MGIVKCHPEANEAKNPLESLRQDVTPLTTYVEARRPTRLTPIAAVLPARSRETDIQR
jgi:hypothetical protein